MHDGAAEPADDADLDRPIECKMKETSDKAAESGSSPCVLWYAKAVAQGVAGAVYRADAKILDWRSSICASCPRSAGQGFVLDKRHEFAATHKTDSFLLRR